MQKNNLQDIFLTKVRKQSLPVTVFLMNGFQMRGSVTGFDSFTVVLDTDGRQQVISSTLYLRLSRCTRWPCMTHACRRRRNSAPAGRPSSVLPRAKPWARRIFETCPGARQRPNTIIRPPKEVTP